MRNLDDPGSDQGPRDAGLLNDAQRPRLLQLLDFDRPQGGSFVPVIAALLEEARGRGWRTDVVVFERSRGVPWLAELESGGAAVSYAPPGSDRALGAWLRRKLDEVDGPALMHSHFEGFDLATVLARRGRAATAIVWHVHSVYPRDPTKVAAATVKFGALGRGVDAIFCPAENIVDSTVRRLAPRAHVKFVPSAISLEQFPPADDEFRRLARENAGIQADRPALLHFGWHRHLKGGDVFVEAVEVMAKRGLDLIALERGGDETYLEHAEKIGVGDRLRLVEPVEDIRELHACADVFVSPSRTEGMAYALLEALATGTPVLATGIPGHAYLAEHMPACRLTELDPVAIADGVEETLGRSAETAEAERRQAQEWIAANLTVEVVARGVVDDYETLLKGRP